jgi:branched-chain amino acid transport system ATP-binding protein
MTAATAASEKPALMLLAGKGISKRFGGVHALADVSFSIHHGEIYGLIGPNGAGKTSLFNVLTGIYSADGGEFTFDGLPLNGLKPNEVAERGIARTFQNIRLFANLSALENVMIGRHVRTHGNVFGAILRGAKTRAEERAIEKRAHELLDYVGIAKRANTLAKHLAYGGPTPAGNCAGARDRAEAPCARRARRRHERDRDRVAQGPARQHPARRHDESS